MSEIQSLFDKLPKTYQRTLLDLARRMEKQSAKGKSKYGTTMDENTNIDVTYWMDHLEEEIADGLVYLQKVKELTKREY